MTTYKKEIRERNNQEIMERLEKASNKKEIERLRNALYFNNESISDGAFGKVAEILSATKNSRKLTASPQGKADVYVRWMNEEGKKTNRPAEVKTNGGRIGSLIKRLEEGKDTLFIYSMSVCNSGTGNSPRELEPIIMPFSLFYGLLVECNALKNTNGRNPEIAIQATSKQLWLRLLEYPIPFNPDYRYSNDDFEGIEI